MTGDLFDGCEPPALDPDVFHADGNTYRRHLDQLRLGTALREVAEVMSDGRWRTELELLLALSCRGVHTTGSSATARLRDLRKPRNGGRHVESRRRQGGGGGTWEYRLHPPNGGQGEP